MRGGEAGVSRLRKNMYKGRIVTQGDYKETSVARAEEQEEHELNPYKQVKYFGFYPENNGKL